jgi:hypothetical protein
MQFWLDFYDYDAKFALNVMKYLPQMAPKSEFSAPLQKVGAQKVPKRCLK